MEDIVSYQVVIRKAEKHLYFYEVTVGSQTLKGQSFGIGQAMNQASEQVFSLLENEGRVK